MTENPVKVQPIKEYAPGDVVCGVKIEPKVAYESGATRSDRTGKGRYDLIPPCALRRRALRFEGGAVEHGDRNWEKGMPRDRLYDSAMRHLVRWFEGDNSEDHLAAAGWQIDAAMYFEKEKAEGRAREGW